MEVSNLYLSVIKDILLERRYTKKEVNNLTIDCLDINSRRIFVYHLGAITAIDIIDEYMPFHNIQKAIDREVRIDKILN
jgi:hypothetical protein